MKSNNELLIFVTEGESHEPKIINRIESIINSRSKKNTILILPFCTSIYGFWKEFKKDENQDALEVLINSASCDSTILKDLDPDHISGIYLIFDYDGHCSNADDSKIIEMLDFFDEETERGKLFISYPMIEAFRDLKKNENLCFTRCKVPIDEFRKYKGLSSSRSDFTCTAEIEIEEMQHIIMENINKLNCIMTTNYQKPTFSNMRAINQKALFIQQEKCFINNHNSVAIISSIPMFIIDYFNEDYYNSLKLTEYSLSRKPECTHDFTSNS